MLLTFEQVYRAMTLSVEHINAALNANPITAPDAPVMFAAFIGMTRDAEFVYECLFSDEGGDFLKKDRVRVGYRRTSFSYDEPVLVGLQERYEQVQAKRVTMINLAENPEHLLTAEHKDEVVLAGRTWVIEVGQDNRIYLTEKQCLEHAGSTSDGEAYPYVHVRRRCARPGLPGTAVMTRQEMIDLIKFNAFAIA